jgi:N-acetylglucosaminyldiphosphoundecaprenol N-acetyl-beta-D-mannosaminyltransferase
MEFRYNRGGMIRPRRIVGTLCAPPADHDSRQLERDLARRLDESKPDILWIGTGTGRQERCMTAMRPRLGVPVMAGVGSAVDVLSGQMRRTDPRRLWRHVGNVRFMRLAAAEMWRHYQRGVD